MARFSQRCQTILPKGAWP